MLWSPQLVVPARKPPAAAGAVTVNATGTKLYHGTSDTSFSYTGLTIAAGSNIALVVGIAWDIGGGATTPTGLSLTWDSGGSNQAMSLIISSDTGAHVGPGVELWGLVNPAVGNLTLAAAWTTNARAFCVGMAFNGVDQTGGATSFPNSARASAAPTVTISSAVGRLVMAQAESGTALSGITGTTIYSDSASGTNINAFANRMDGAASVAIGEGNNVHTIVGTDIKAA